MIRVGVCGCGFLGMTHVRTLDQIEGVTLAALCDVRIADIKAPDKDGNVPFPSAQGYDSFERMLQVEKLDAVVIATPTDLHPQLTVAALKAGCHVFCEKPMALDLDGCNTMIAARHATGRLLMIGQCVRFWPEYEYLADAVNDGRYGKLRSLHMERMGPFPGGWFADHRRAGGAVIDLHVHDVDWAQYILGVPERISAAGAIGRTGGVDDVTSVWEYTGGPVVTMRATWFYHYPFHMRYAALFDNATLLYDLGTGLRCMKAGDTTEETIACETKNGHVRELEYFVECVRDNTPNTRCTAESTRESIALALTERDQILANRKEPLPA